MAAPTFKWNSITGQYLRSNGQFVTIGEVTDTLDRALRSAQARAHDLSLSFRARRISTSEWSLGMREIIKDTQLYSAAVASGGLKRMTPQLNGFVGQRIRVQYDFIANFTREIRQGLPLDGNFLTRVDLYVLQGWSTWAAFRDLNARARGMTEERNVRTAGESCSGCITQSARQWVPLGSLVPIGSRQCLSRCKCYKEYR